MNQLIVLRSVLGTQLWLVADRTWLQPMKSVEQHQMMTVNKPWYVNQDQSEEDTSQSKEIQTPLCNQSTLGRLLSMQNAKVSIIMLNLLGKT